MSLGTLSPSKQAFIMSGVIVAMLMSALDQTIVSTAIPKIVSDLNGLDKISWVVTAYLLSSTITVPIYGKLSDIYGRKWFFAFGIVIFLLGSALSGLSQSMIQLIFFRGLQGIGGGALTANAFAIIGDIFPPAKRGKFQGIIGGVFGLASVAGPLLGGWITDNASWRWIFYINIPLGIIAFIIILLAIPKIEASVHKRVIDYLGACTLTAGLLPLLLAFVWAGNQYPWESVQIIGLLVFAISMLLVFGFIESKVQEPILPLTLFHNKVFVVSTIVTFLTSVGLFGAILYIPLFAQDIIGSSATNSGLILTPMMLSLVVSSIIAGQIISRTGRYKIVALCGLFLSLTGVILLSHMSVTTGNTDLVRNMIVTGLGLGVTMPIFTIAVQSAFDRSQLGVVTASMQLFRNLGSTIGVAVLGTVFNNTLGEKLVSLYSDPFVRSLATLQHTNPSTILDPNKIQGLISPDGIGFLQKGIAQLPAPLQTSEGMFLHTFLTSIRGALASAVSEIFVIGSFIMFIAYIVCFFLPEIELRKSVLPQDIAKEGESIGLELGEQVPS